MPSKRTVILSSGDVSEARTGQRFPLELPITIRHPDSSPEQEEALTCDVSASGVYIKASSKIHVGTTIEFEIALPAAVMGTESDVAIRCRGRVIRMDDHSGTGKSAKDAKENGVGCVIDQYEFVRKDKGKNA